MARDLSTQSGARTAIMPRAMAYAAVKAAKRHARLGKARQNMGLTLGWSTGQESVASTTISSTRSRSGTLIPIQAYVVTATARVPFVAASQRIARYLEAKVRRSASDARVTSATSPKPTRTTLVEDVHNVTPASVTWSDGLFPGVLFFAIAIANGLVAFSGALTRGIGF